MLYPRGSEWRRWDLHVHTPASIVQDYGGDTPEAWDAFITHLQGLPSDISVLSITDYLFIDGYEQLLARRDELPNIHCIFPNIEFRLNTFSGTASNHRRHNFHVLFDPSVSPQTIREQLLNCLSTAYRVDDSSKWNRTPTPASLIELGKMMKAAAPADNSVQARPDLRVGFDSITYKREDILENLQKDCFHGKYLIAIGYSEWDQARWDQSAAEKRTLINDAHFSLVNNDDIGKIAEHVAELDRNKLNSLILHSSDSHSLARLGQTKLWIKSDPTFAGLKQVINEPERAFIGDAPPRFKQPHQIISKITIPASQDWFGQPFELELNEGLVAVIGGRGSGKSAFAEMIGYGVGLSDGSDDSFVNKALKHPSSIADTKVLLTWADGSVTSGTVGDAQEDGGNIKYLPQKAVEKLCSPGNSDELVSQIETVIFQSLDPTATLGASDFNELKTNLLGGFSYEQSETIQGIRQHNRDHFAADAMIRSLPSKTKELNAKKKELATLVTETPKLPQADEKSQNELAAFATQRRLFEDRIAALGKQLEQVNALQTKVRLFQSTFATFASDLQASAKAVGVRELGPFALAFDGETVQQALRNRSAEIQAEIDQLKAGTKDQVAALLKVDASSWPFTNHDSLVALIQAKTNETRAFETQKLKFQQHKAKIDQMEKTIVALQAEADRIKAEVIPNREFSARQRFDKYSEYFKILQAQRVEIAKLYRPLQKMLAEGSETDRRLQFEAQLVYRLDEHLEKGLAILDRTKRGNFRDVQVLKAALGRMWDSFVRHAFEAQQVRAALVEMWNQFTTVTNEGAATKIDISSQLREGYTEQDFFDWFLDVSHYDVTSSLRFDDTDLYFLSPGKKGIVLLMLYLGLDTADTRPMVIDQPEDNLDNLSVYKDLIRLFKERKQHRQIILVTHNPNLVVNTDAEQIIVATFDGKAHPRISYSSGSLENQAEQIPDVPVADLTDGIIEKVCAVLEGGPNAFSKRSKVYSLSPKMR